MKTITLYIETGEPIIIDDDDDRNIEEYVSDLSSILQEGNIVVLQTSSACMIIRPSRITGIEVKESNIKKFIKPYNKHVAKKSAIKKADNKKIKTQKKDKIEDIILDE